MRRGNIAGENGKYFLRFAALTLVVGILLRLYWRLIRMHFWSEQVLKEDELCLDRSIQSNHLHI